DSDVQATIKATKGKEVVPITYNLSLIRPMKTESVYHFDNAMLSFNHVSADAQITVFQQKEKKEVMILNHDRKWATTFYQSFYLKWKFFLEKAVNQRKLDAITETSLATTQLITDIYAKGKRQ
ncbi:MAG: hypothetical protein AABX72_03835, partial [Nanoarchaeota archaeon]